MRLLSRDVTLVRCMSMSGEALGKAVGLIHGLCSSTLSTGIHPVYCGWVPRQGGGVFDVQAVIDPHDVPSVHDAAVAESEQPLDAD